MENSESIELDIVDAGGNNVGLINVSESVFKKSIKPGLLHQAVRWHRAKARSGTHSVLTRSEVRGGGAKPWRQKGTGRARAGSNNSPVWVGGGVAHGPSPRNYGFRFNKEERRQALAGALSARYEEGRLIVLKSFGLNEVKTKKAVEALRAVGIAKGAKVLVVLTHDDDVEAKSLRNVPGVKVLSPQSLNVYEVLNANHLLVVEDAVSQIEDRLVIRPSGGDD